MKATGHPDHTYVLVYPGGYGGEFLCYWLGQHSGCIPTPTSFLPNNRYVTKFDQTRIHPRADALKLFLPGHDQITHQAKNGFVATARSRVIGTSVSIGYQKFYFLLFAMKTLLFKHTSTYMVDHASPEQHLQFLSVIYPRTEFYHDEFTAWQSTQTVSAIDYLLEQRFKQACIQESSGVDRVSIRGVDFCINLDQLFFGNFVDRATEYQRLCDYIGTVPDAALLHQLDQYHDKNMDLVYSVTGMSALEFVALSNDQALPVIQQACQRLV